MNHFIGVTCPQALYYELSLVLREQKQVEMLRTIFYH